MGEIELVRRVKYAGDVHKKLVELGWDSETAALFCDDLPDADVTEVRHGELIETGFDEVWCSWGNCTVCGCSNIMGVKYCNECGTKLDGGTENA